MTEAHNEQQKDLMTHPIDALTTDELRVFVNALRGVVRHVRVDYRRADLEAACNAHQAASYRITLTEERLREAQAENRGRS